MDSSRSPRVLLVLPQFPQDPAAGAPRSLTTICGLLAASGFSVRGLAVTASVSRNPIKAETALRDLGIAFSTERRKRPEFRYQHRGISFRLIDVAELSFPAWMDVFGRVFDSAFDEELRTFQPDVVFTYGGLPADQRRQERAHKSGAKVIFGLRNEFYLSNSDWHRHIDAFITPSHYLSKRYREAIGIDTYPMPTPIEAADCLAEERDPIFLTMINPSFEKGVVAFATLAEELSKQRPDLPILVVESRGTAGLLAEIGERGGFNLRRHENIMFSPAVPTSKDLYLPSRILAVPSLADAAPRVIPEAMLNGIPPLVSDRGGLSEYAGGAGFTFPIPADITPATRKPVSPEVVQPWIDAIIRLFDDEDFYRAECEKARNAAKRFSPEVLAPQYAKYFLKIIAGG